jgi:hypothetical protein
LPSAMKRLSVAGGSCGEGLPQRRPQRCVMHGQTCPRQRPAPCRLFLLSCVHTG